ncbi:hypothetical protein BDB00DRAFT_866878 [Zychaea mexicana]|uniref:uncharacterized protein n=1 Tax=Zychaea mexicana TaxID=64656 RepID=UPI0022FE4C74|nr:uncharacterized protein BDB00DRAFT_866878 [Zychaea mexicana]KAI9499398.1 hypothetical protein BDB00DRAFT_866878 [Zychaea mexicana]
MSSSFITEITAPDVKAGLYINNEFVAGAVSNALEAGTNWVNNYYSASPAEPFGGYKQSGIARKCGEYALDKYTQVKAMKFNTGKPM